MVGVEGVLTAEAMSYPAHLCVCVLADREYIRDHSQGVHPRPERAACIGAAWPAHCSAERMGCEPGPLAYDAPQHIRLACAIAGQSRFAHWLASSTVGHRLTLPLQGSAELL